MGNTESGIGANVDSRGRGGHLLVGGGRRHQHHKNYNLEFRVPVSPPNTGLASSSSVASSPLLVVDRPNPEQQEEEEKSPKMPFGGFFGRRQQHHQNRSLSPRRGAPMTMTTASTHSEGTASKVNKVGCGGRITATGGTGSGGSLRNSRRKRGGGEDALSVELDNASLQDLVLANGCAPSLALSLSIHRPSSARIVRPHQQRQSASGAGGTAPFCCAPSSSFSRLGRPTTGAPMAFASSSSPFSASCADRRRAKSFRHFPTTAITTTGGNHNNGSAGGLRAPGAALPSSSASCSVRLRSTLGTLCPVTALSQPQKRLVLSRWRQLGPMDLLRLAQGTLESVFQRRPDLAARVLHQQQQQQLGGGAQKNNNNNNKGEGEQQIGAAENGDSRGLVGVGIVDGDNNNSDGGRDCCWRGNRAFQVHAQRFCHALAALCATLEQCPALGADQLLEFGASYARGENRRPIPASYWETLLGAMCEVVGVGQHLEGGFAANGNGHQQFLLDPTNGRHLSPMAMAPLFGSKRSADAWTQFAVYVVNQIRFGYEMERFLQEGLRKRRPLLATNARGVAMKRRERGEEEGEERDDNNMDKEEHQLYKSVKDDEKQQQQQESEEGEEEGDDGEIGEMAVTVAKKAAAANGIGLGRTQSEDLPFPPSPPSPPTQQSTAAATVLLLTAPAEDKKKRKSSLLPLRRRKKKTSVVSLPSDVQCRLRLLDDASKSGGGGSKATAKTKANNKKFATGGVGGIIGGTAAAVASRYGRLFL